MTTQYITHMYVSNNIVVHLFSSKFLSKTWKTEILMIIETNTCLYKIRHEKRCDSEACFLEQQSFYIYSEMTPFTSVHITAFTWDKFILLIKDKNTENGGRNLIDLWCI